MRKVSLKMQAQHRAEAQLKKRMIEKVNGNGYMAPCAWDGEWVWVEKHELNPRSLGGDPLDEANCVLLCHFHHTREKDPALRHRNREDFPFRGPV